MPVYPGDPATKVEAVGILKRDGWVDHYLSMGTHAGTHIDAPAHMIDGGMALDEFPVERFIGRGRIVPAADGFDLGGLETADVRAGDIVLFDTGTSDVYRILRI